MRKVMCAVIASALLLGSVQAISAQSHVWTTNGLEGADVNALAIDP